MNHPFQFTNRIYTETGGFNVAELVDSPAWPGATKPSEKRAYVSDCPRTLLWALTRFFATGLEGFLTTPARFDSELAGVLGQEGFAVFDHQGNRIAEHTALLNGTPYTERICLQTSGTTGRPKLITHSHTGLVTINTQRRHPEQRWLAPYLPGTYAWYQMATLGLFSPSQHLILPPRSAPMDMWVFAQTMGCTAISSTPAFWRCLFLNTSSATLAKAPLRQITLGGEPIDQTLLDQLQALFPRAQITHIYASTESGAAVVVHDGREGFPLEWLTKQRPGRPALRIQNGKLWIKSPYAATDSPSWRDTGDRVEIRDDRVVVMGRQTADLVNVGGQKVDPRRVEGILLRNPRVVWCRVFARTAPLVGQLVAAEVAFESLAFSANWELELHRFCLEQGLQDWMIPRVWTQCHEVPLALSGKSRNHSHA